TEMSLTSRGFREVRRPESSLCRAERAPVAKNGGPVPGPVKPFPGRNSWCEQRPGRISIEKGSSPPAHGVNAITLHKRNRTEDSFLPAAAPALRGFAGSAAWPGRDPRGDSTRRVRDD